MLTIEQLKKLKVGDYVWVKTSNQSLYVQKTGNSDEHLGQYVNMYRVDVYPYETYEKDWVAYKNKEEAECSEALYLPCKIGDPVFVLYEDCSGIDCPFNGGYGQARCRAGEDEQPQCGPYLRKETFLHHTIPWLGKHAFVDEKSANKVLERAKDKSRRR